MRCSTRFALTAIAASLIATTACANGPAVGTAAGPAVGPVAASGPAPNPFLAQSYNNQTHWNDAATDSVGFTVPRGNFEITPESVQVIPNESVSLPLVMDHVGGKDIYWWWAGFSLRKVTVENGKLTEIARTDIPVRLPNYTPVTPTERQAQAEKVKAFLAARDEAGLLAYMKSQPNRMVSFAEDQVANGAVYAVLGRDDTFYGCSGRQIFRIDQLDPKSPASGMTPLRAATLPASLFDNEKIKRGKTRLPADILFGMGMTYNGYLVVNTLGGKVVTLDRNSLQVIDSYTVSGADEMFMNSFATGPEAGGGAVYVASNTTMYRLVVDIHGKIHDDEASGAWHANYDRGVVMPAPKIADGTGSTPTLMGFGPDEDKLVVITDGARKMRMVAFWRDNIPAGWKAKPGTQSPRIADQLAVDMGPKLESVQSEQSVSAFGDYAFVVNNIPTNDSPQIERGGGFTSLINGATRPGPSGVAMLKWQQRTHNWKMQWVRTDVSSISVVPMISGGGRMAIVDGYFTNRWNDRYHIGMDLDTGKTVMTIRTGTDPTFNGLYSPVKVDAEGHIFYSGAFGLMRLDTSRMKRVTGDDVTTAQRQ
ncbi:MULTISPECIES: hypothetical protein [Cupriavidus]|uniref:hypothetical protein n=1 Tax=Cupriavidus TaxID=106589 RepID=UPI0002A313F9|nr:MULTISPECIES: hypothetical protein [Cupriavidus]EKZ97201.1 hypothetical protein D769_21324 [Cupriavidus sp. HMR-1]